MPVERQFQSLGNIQCGIVCIGRHGLPDQLARSMNADRDRQKRRLRHIRSCPVKIGISFFQTVGILFTKFFGRREAVAYWRAQISAVLKTVALCASSWYVVRLVPVAGMKGFAVKGVAAAVFVAVAMCILFRGEVSVIASRLLRGRLSQTGPAA